MKVLVFTTGFPSPARPLHGLFVLERLRRAARHAEVCVVAPAPWFRRSLGRDRREMRDGLAVERPTFFYLPGLLKALDGFFLFLSALPAVR